MKKLRDVAPPGGSVSDGHGSKLKRVSTVCPASRRWRFSGFPPLRFGRPASRRWRFSGFPPLRSSHKLPLLAAVVLVVAAGLVGCPSPPRAPAPPAERRIPSAPPALQQGRQGRPYDIASSDSLLTLRVFRGGALAKAGHNHVIASHTLRGTFYVPADPARTSFEVHLPVTDLTIDEAVLREQEHSEDFPPDIPDSAKEGTRKNMLSPALLDGEHYPEILLQSGSLDPDPAGTGWLAHIQVTVRDRTNTVVVPVRYEQQGDAIILTGEFPLKQTDLGLTPFTALLGALQVVDEMKVRFHIVARAGISLQP